jgi:hypothetical protein
MSIEAELFERLRKAEERIAALESNVPFQVATLRIEPDEFIVVKTTGPLFNYEERLRVVEGFRKVTGHKVEVVFIDDRVELSKVKHERS